MRRAELGSPRGVSRHGPVARATSDQPVTELSLCRATVTVLRVGEARRRGVVLARSVEPETPCDLEQPDQILDGSGRRPPPEPPRVTRRRDRGTGALARTRATSHAIADHSQRRARIGDCQPGVLARKAVTQMGRAAHTARDDANHSYRSQPPSGGATGALFGSALRDRDETLMVTSWKNWRICRASSARWTRAFASARNSWSTA